MPTQEEVLENLDIVLVLGVMRSLVKMNVVRNVSVANGKVDITLASAALASETQEWRKEKVKDAAAAPLLGQLSIDPELAKLCDEGNIERYDAEMITSLGESLSQATTAGTEQEVKS